MRHVFQPELLAALKDSVHNLENLKTLSPNDVEIVRLKRFLRQKIDALEKEYGGSDGHKMAAD